MILLVRNYIHMNASNKIMAVFLVVVGIKYPGCSKINMYNIIMKPTHNLVIADRVTYGLYSHKLTETPNFGSR